MKIRNSKWVWILLWPALVFGLLLIRHIPTTLSNSIGTPAPSYTFVLTGYATYEGEKAYIFEASKPDTQSALGPATYVAVCDGNMDKVNDASCSAIGPYLGHVIPPAYFCCGDGDLEWIDVPSLNLQFLIEEVN